jgi:glycosyltransferase involved in cell wall biosynthesis
MSVESERRIPLASVVICTHNSRADHLDRTLDALRRQTLPLQDWELLLVDNASKIPLASGRDLSWHPNARHVLETQLGLSRARAQGIAEAAADLIVFVDDDNVLNETYLVETLRIARDCPFLGAWGAGCIQGEFEVEPLESLRSWLPVRESAVPRWSNLAGSYLLGESPDEAIPWGAGLCIRRELAIAYREFCDQSSIYITDRHGASLVGGGDTEIAFVCCSRGLGVGVFPELKLTHLIPRHRVSDQYLARFAEGTCLSNTLLRYNWQHKAPHSPFSARTPSPGRGSQRAVGPGPRRHQGAGRHPVGFAGGRSRSSRCRPRRKPTRHRVVLIATGSSRNQ